MKLSVGRIVHAYRVREDIGGVEKRGPFAGIVVGLGSSGAGIKVLDPVDSNLDSIRLFELEEHKVYRRYGDNVGWLWCWPPREV